MFKDKNKSAMYQLMKPQSWLVNLVAIATLISCHRTEPDYSLQQLENTSLLKKELALKPTLAENYQTIVDKYQAITDNRVRQLIDAISPGEMRIIFMKPDKKRKITLPICFAAPEAQEIMFAPASLLEEAALILQEYYSKCPNSNKVQIVSVVEYKDWLQLLQKEGPGTGTGDYTEKSTSYQKRVKLGNYVPPSERAMIEKDEERIKSEGGINTLFRYIAADPHSWVRLCEKNWMDSAVDIIPPQKDTESHASWSCGPNSAAKAIHMFGCHISERDYRNKFLPNVPRYFPKDTTQNVGIGIHIAGSAAILLAPFTGGASLGIALGGLGATIGSGAVILGSDSLPRNSGVSATDLGKYVTKVLPGSRSAEFWSCNKFEDCARAIRDDLERGYPVIVKWIFSPFNGHYVNVVSVELYENGLPSTFTIMDTDNCLYGLCWQDMRNLMRRDFLSAALEEKGNYDKFHLVRFRRQ